jgi:hypothetical protein
MLSPLKIGTVLLQTGTLVPDSVCVKKEIFCPGWQAITNVNGDDLDRQIRGKGWNFFFLCGALQGTYWGSWSGVAVRRAAIRVLRKTQATKLNGFEITGIHERRFLGVRHVVLTGHSRHVQKSTVLQDITERIRQAPQPVASSISDAACVTPWSSRPKNASAAFL